MPQQCGDAAMEKVGRYLLEKRATLLKEWQAFSAVALMAGLAVWSFATIINNERFATLGERIALKDDEIAMLRAERDKQSGTVSSLQDTLSEVLSRLRALEENALTSVLEGQPANVEVIAGPQKSAWSDYLSGTFTQSGWNVQIGAPGDASYPNLAGSDVVLKPSDQQSGDTIRQALDAAKIPYENLIAGEGVPAIKVEGFLPAELHK